MRLDAEKVFKVIGSKGKFKKTFTPCGDLFLVQYLVGLPFICTCSEQNTACALLFTLFSAQFLVHFLSNLGDRRLRVRVITVAAVRLRCLLVCLLVTS